MADDQTRPKFVREISLGNMLSVLAIVGGVATFFLNYNDRLLKVEAAQTSADQRGQQFQREILQRLEDLQTDVRELRAENGVRWRELPPSPYRRRNP